VATGDADTYTAGLLSQDPDNHPSLSNLASDHTKNHSFWRGFRNCVEGQTYDTNWSQMRREGYKAAQALGLFNLTL
jgi:hypothetical protein